MGGCALFRIQRIKNPKARQSGFSLIELLMVVSILAAVSGIGFFALSSDTLEEKYVTLAKVEMQTIAKAVKQFKRDTGYYPGQGPFAILDRKTGVINTCADRCPIGTCDSRGGVAPDVIRDERHANVILLDDRTPDMWMKSPINMMQLLTPPQFCMNHPLAYLAEWDESTNKGWHGPYLSREGYVDTDCSLSADHDVDRGLNGRFGEPDSYDTTLITNCPFTDSAGDHSNVLGNLFNLPAIADPFESNNERATDRGGVLHWRNKPVASNEADPDKITQSELGRIGQPYLLFFRKQFVDEDNNPLVSPELVARLVSAGPDKVHGEIFETHPAVYNAPAILRDDWCSPNKLDPAGKDDIVLCF